MAGSVIEARGLSLRLGVQTLFSDLSFSIPAGQKVLIGGRSGSGKSTLLKCLLGLVLPQAGELSVGGTRLTTQSVWSARRLMGYLAQEPDLGRGTVQSVLEAPFRFVANQRHRPEKTRIQALFERFFLEDHLLTQDVTRLSGGQKQRVALIGTLLLDRSIYLLDEPTSALDEPSRRAVADYFDDSAATVLWISHDTHRLWKPDQVLTPNGGEGEP